jgi:hypothetical protein
VLKKQIILSCWHLLLISISSMASQYTSPQDILQDTSPQDDPCNKMIDIFGQIQKSDAKLVPLADYKVEIYMVPYPEDKTLKSLAVYPDTVVVNTATKTIDFCAQGTTCSWAYQFEFDAKERRWYCDYGTDMPKSWGLRVL